MSSQRPLSAVLCTVAHNSGSGQGETTPFSDNSTRWLALVEAELTDDDRLTLRNGFSFDIELEKADESRALQIARLIRNSFQLHTSPGSKVRLSTGVVLHAAGSSSKAEFRAIAENLAMTHSSDVGNKISFENHGSAGRSSV